MALAERSSSHTIFAWPRIRTDKRSGVFGFGQSRRSYGDVSPCAKHRIPLRQQAMTMRLSGRCEHRVMKAMAGEADIAMGKELACANGDCGVDKVNSVTECRDEAIEPISQGADAQLLARRNSPDGRLDLDE
jgi:hypothetical protein